MQNSGTWSVDLESPLSCRDARCDAIRRDHSLRVLAQVGDNAARDSGCDALPGLLPAQRWIDERLELVIDGAGHRPRLNGRVSSIHAHGFCTLIVGLAVVCPACTGVSVTAGGVVPPIGATCVCALYFVMRSFSFCSSASRRSSATLATATASSASSFAELR